MERDLDQEESELLFYDDGEDSTINYDDSSDFQPLVNGDGYPINEDNNWS